MKTRNLNAGLMILALLSPLAWMGCGGGENPGEQNSPIIGEPYQSDCLADTDGADGNTVEILVAGDEVTIVDHHAEFNCCLAVWMEVEIDSRDITVVEVEDPDQSLACDCICPYELSISIRNLDQGQYTVRVYRFAPEAGNLIHQETIAVGGNTKTAYLESFRAACGECGVEECYEPGAPRGVSEFSFELQPDPRQDGRFRIRAVHQVKCIDADILGAELFIEGNDLVLVEEFDYDNPFDCYCNQEAAILISGVAPGTYGLKIFDNDRTRLLVEDTLVISTSP